MKVKSVEAIPLQFPDPKNEAATGGVGHQLLVRIETDDGIVGWGDTWTRFAEANKPVADIVDAVSELVIGRDPIQTNEIYKELAQRMYWYGEGGIAWLALSAIDIALWDIKGKATGLCLVDMLGGAVTPDLPAIVATHPIGPEISQMVDEAEVLITDRMAGCKFGFLKGAPERLGIDHQRDVSFMSALRHALGDECILAADIRAALDWDVRTAVTRMQAFEEYDLAWIEEPFKPWDVESYRVLRTRANTLVGYGEREWTVAGYQRILSDGQADVIGVDPGRVGGVTATWNIAQRIAAASRIFNGHCWSGAINSAVGLAVACASGASIVFEFKPHPDPMQMDLVTEPLQPNDKRVAPPRKPGVGVEVVEDVVDTYRVDR